VERDIGIMVGLRTVIGSGNAWLDIIIATNRKRLKPFLPILCTGKTNGCSGDAGPVTAAAGVQDRRAARRRGASQ